MLFAIPVSQKFYSQFFIFLKELSDNSPYEFLGAYTFRHIPQKLSKSVSLYFRQFSTVFADMLTSRYMDAGLPMVRFYERKTAWLAQQ